jgi:hypothetical protein
MSACISATAAIYLAVGTLMLRGAALQTKEAAVTVP